MHIRPDLEGVVHVAGLVLAAGDAIPDGVVVGEHLIAKEQAGGSTGKRRGRGSASRPASDD